jgi:tetratricopeptide (TPR) repeat protein
MVRHLPFIEALAHAPPEDWDTLKVGYLVLRVFDDWLRSGPAVMMSDSRFEMIYQDIERIPPVNAAHGRACRAILDAFLTASTTEPSAVAAPMMAYAALLGSEKRWTLAANVYETVSNAFAQDQPLPLSDRETLANALIQQGGALRKAGQFDEAVRAYRGAGIVAKHGPLKLHRLQAFIGLGNIARARGNLPRAERIFSAVLRSAEYLGPQVAVAYADAYHGRGAVRHARGKYTEAIRDLFMAYQLTEDMGTRELILTDLGVCAGDAGYRSAARDALTLIADHGYSSTARTIAIVNLLELAVLDDDKTEFERRQEEWERLRSGSDPNTQAYANVYVARGAARFIKGTIAEQAYQNAIEYAKQMRIHHVEFLASKEFDELQRENEVKIPSDYMAARPIPEELTDIARALSDMRDRALTAV